MTISQHHKTSNIHTWLQFLNFASTVITYHLTHNISLDTQHITWHTTYCALWQLCKSLAVVDEMHL